MQSPERKKEYEYEYSRRFEVKLRRSERQRERYATDPEYRAKRLAYYQRWVNNKKEGNDLQRNS